MKKDFVERLIEQVSAAGYPTEEPEAPKDAPFGQYLFGQERGFGEPDTEAEKRLTEALRWFIGEENEPGKLAKFAPLILELMKKHQYLPLLDPGTERVYRGMSLEASEVKTILKPYGPKFRFDPEATGPVICNLPDKLHTLDHRKHLASWSLSPGIAAGFATDRMFDDRGFVAVVFAARPHAEGNCFFGRPGSLPPAVGLAGHLAEEQETISFGPVGHDGFAYLVPNKKNVADLKNTLTAGAKKIH